MNNALAARITSHHPPSRRDNRTICTKEMVSDHWSVKPPNASAVVCYRSDSSRKIRDTSANHYHYIGHRYCTEFSFLHDSDVEYGCFYLIGANTFEAEDDAGYDNLAILSAPGKCTWSNKVLDCKA
ncbi:putative glycerophosphoinositol permease [Pseudozyma hubeiensis]|nr:putative glycerophosphoinositol permease [Pseudozyma hubeiensis]